MGDTLGWRPPSCEGQRGLAWRRRTGAMQGVNFAEFIFHALGCIRGLSPPLWDTWSLFGVEKH
jgi:hypothetical protein